MKLSNLSISARLIFLGGLAALALIAVGLGGWRTTDTSNARSVAAMARAATLTDGIDAARAAQVEFKTQVQEWKNILLRGGDPEQLAKYTASFKKSGEATQADLKSVDALLDKLGMKTDLVDQALKAHADLNTNYLKALEQFDSANPDSPKIVDGLVKGMDRAPTAKIGDIVTFMQKQNKDGAAAAMKANAEAQQAATIQLGLIVLATIIIGAMVMGWIIRSITTPLHNAVEIAQTVAAGDLSSHIDVHGEDEVAKLMAALKHMHDNLAMIVARVRVGTETIASASTQIASGNLELSSRTEQQASSLEETASSMQELTQTVKQSSENAQEASFLANDASVVASKGGAVVAEVVTTMGSINESSRKIVDIIAVIDGIAFQTNILALNAAVEAARAGEQGRGFAVVASEVRNLAQRSAAAAKEIKELISDSVDKVENGSKLVGQAGATMQEVVNSVQRVTTIISDIAAAAGEQNDGISQINDAITQMDSVTQQNAALVEEAAASAEAMQTQAEALKDAVSVFKISAATMAAVSGVPGTARKAPQVRHAPAKRIAAPAQDSWE
jgi:methyl-accepting chemotaxis protein-1 (serine sensor receptor)